MYYKDDINNSRLIQFKGDTEQIMKGNILRYKFFHLTKKSALIPNFFFKPAI
jgi:hypothetical protein